MQRAFVTGATGCIGRALTRQLLDNGVNVRAIVRDIGLAQSVFGLNPNLELILGDLSSLAALQQGVKDVDCVFHLAAKVHTKPRTQKEHNQFFEVNVAGTQRLLDACTAASVKTFVFFSTIAVFGGESSPFNEQTPVAPITSYAKSKYEAEKLVMQWQQKAQAHAVILRLSMVFGEGDRGNFQRMVRAISKGRFVTFGRARKSVAYSANVVDIAIAVTDEKVKERVLVVADPGSYTLNEIAQYVADALGRRLHKSQLPVWPLRIMGNIFSKVTILTGVKMPFEASDVIALTSNTDCDTSKLTRVLNIQPRFGIAESISRSVAWYQSDLQS